MVRDYAHLGFLADLLVFGGIVALARTSGAVPTALSTSAIVAGVVLFGAFWRLQTRPVLRAGRPGAPSPDEGLRASDDGGACGNGVSVAAVCRRDLAP
jgi:hypothetical protein